MTGDHRRFSERAESASQYIAFLWLSCPTVG